jgi:hypothetical protein
MSGREASRVSGCSFSIAPTAHPTRIYRHVAWRHVSVHDENKQWDFKDNCEYVQLFALVISLRSLRCSCRYEYISFLFNTTGRCDSLGGKWILGRVTFYLCKCACYNALYARVLNYATQL